jgi:hypothetical protein
VRVPHLSPTPLTSDEQRLILRATAGSARDHTIIALAVGTGMGLVEIVGLNVGEHPRLGWNTSSVLSVHKRLGSSSSLEITTVCSRSASPLRCMCDAMALSVATISQYGKDDANASISKMSFGFQT